MLQLRTLADSPSSPSSPETALLLHMIYSYNLLLMKAAKDDKTINLEDLGHSFTITYMHHCNLLLMKAAKVDKTKQAGRYNAELL